jgi:hypothetical protein
VGTAHGATRSSPISFARFGGICAILAGVAGFCYSVSFVIIDHISSSASDKLSALFLLLGGAVGSAALVALYERLRRDGADSGFLLWALLLGLVSALGSAIHGGYDLANALHTPASNPDLPSGIDPRGLLTFGLAGVAALTFATLIRRSPDLPRNFGTLGLVLGALLVIIYLGRLIILSAHNPVIVIPAVITGFVVSPIWYVWLGRLLLREPEDEAV